MVEETMAVSTKLDRPAYFIGDVPFPIQQFHRMKSRQVFRQLQKVEMDSIEKLQKLKMDCFGNDRARAKTQTVLCNSTYEVTKPLRMYYAEIEETSTEFKIPNIPEVFRKLWQEELEMIEKLRKLKLNQVRLDQKRKCFSGSFTSYSHRSMYNTRQKIEGKVKEIEELKESLYELYVSRKPHQRNDSDDICSLHEELRKGRNHGSKNLVEERQLLRKINHIRGEVEKNQKISANLPTEPATRVYTWRGDTLDTKEALTNYIKEVSREFEELRMKQMTYRAYDDRAERQQIKISERKMDTIKQKKVQASFQTKT